MKYCHNKSDIPKEPHFAIIEFTSVYIPGDERSRTNPGHGYPETTEYYSHYIAFSYEGEWKAAIEKYMSGSNKDNFVAIRVNPVKIKTSVTIEIT